MSTTVSIPISSLPSPTPIDVVSHTQLAQLQPPPTSSILPSPSLSTSAPSPISSTSSSPSNTSSAAAKSSSTKSSPPIAAIAGASAGALVLIIIIMAIWYIFRRRRQQSSKTSPIMSSKGRDLEQQLSSHHSSEKESPRSSSSPHSHPRRSGHSHNSSRNGQQPRPFTTVQHDNYNNNSTTIHDPILLRSSSHKNKAASAHSFASLASENNSISGNNGRSSLKPQHRRQPSIPPTPSPPVLPTSRPATRTPTPTPIPMASSTAAAAMTINKADAESKRRSAVLSAVANQPTDVHIDMLDVDVEKLLPIIITDEIPAPPENIPLVQKQFLQQGEEQRKDQSCVTVNNDKGARCLPTFSTSTATPFMSSALTRQPSLATRKSTESHRMPMSTSPHMPPPPPPSVPPPAIPLTYPGGMPDGGCSATVVIANARGRKPRALTESISSIASSTRRSISLDSTEQPWNESLNLSTRAKPGNTPSGISQWTSKKIILPPSTPSPATPSSAAPPISSSAIKQMSQQIPVHRRRHQKSPSQILSTGFFVSPERSPLSPPMSPLTVQIPRNVPSVRLSMLGSASNNNNNNVHAYHSAFNRPDSPTTGYNNPTSPLSSSAPTNKSVRAIQIQAQQNRKVRSKSISISQTETQRIIGSASSSSNITSSRSSTTMRSIHSTTPSMSIPTRLADFLPPPAPALSHLTHLHGLSQSYQQQPTSKNSWDGSYPSTTTPTSATGRSTTTTGVSTDEDDEREHLQRRSMSLDYWTNLQHLNRSSPTSPTVSEDPEGSTMGSVATERDLDVQMIISDALAIAAAKSVAIEAARQSTWYSQQELQRLGGNGTTSRPWTPSEDQWGSTSLSSSRSQSPLYSTSTPSPSH